MQVRNYMTLVTEYVVLNDTESVKKDQLILGFDNKCKKKREGKSFFLLFK